MTTIICRGGSLHNQQVTYQGSKYSPSPKYLPLSKQEHYRLAMDAQGAYFYIERWFARMFYCWVAKQHGAVPMPGENWTQFQDRAPIFWPDASIVF